MLLTSALTVASSPATTRVGVMERELTLNSARETGVGGGAGGVIGAGVGAGCG